MSEVMTSYIGEAPSGPGSYRDIEMISFDGGQNWYDWQEDISEVSCPDASDRGEVVILEDGDMVILETNEGEVFILIVNTDAVNDELNYNIQERIYPT
jgi:hypothetical protein